MSEVIEIIHETRWIASWFEQRVGLTPEGYVTYELIPLLLDHPRFAKLQIDREVLEGLLATGDPVLYRDFISGLFLQGTFLSFSKRFYPKRAVEIGPPRTPARQKG